MTGGLTEMENRKKIYGKPEIVYEDFSLTATIAAACANSTNPTYNVCGTKYPGVSETLFTGDIPGCDTKVDDGFGGICYHTPIDGTKLFNSI